MRCYEINGLKVTAKSKAEAEQIDKIFQDECHREGRALIFIPEGGEPYVIPLPSETTRIFSQSGDTIVYVGQLLGGTGQQILNAALGNIDNVAKEAAKLRLKRKGIARIAKESEYTEIVGEFEDKIPSHCRSLFLSIVDRICNDNDAYKVVMYQGISANVEIRSENWSSILDWFGKNVLEGRNTLFQKRKSFVTAVIRMGAVEGGVSNSIESTREKDDPKSWDKYLDQE